MCTTRVGTLQWRAPEIATSQSYGTSADTYSFGIVLWEMQTCDLPFSHYKFGFQIEDAVSAGERPLVPSKCPGDLRKLILDCWHANPKFRPAFPQVLSRLNSILNKICLAPDKKNAKHSA
ncbi:mitogen-activated protein kinase kinase kinase 20-like [Corticium candelabrum]|uniref:mitogen-activated protein kinase kinase kinase 20-like n=1 Tax=Corticium candelabrum TaxID=121492 RepID=UPI002E262CE3|nr:mitogen-activated protein kinase kinase kinase 20-like [Corticium candelabrum]